ncbi:MAG: hypothetical protein JO020_15500 [Chloroflexi bacterium]|nr:hypothetical protein [Chloroflexota bacterium]
MCAGYRARTQRDDWRSSRVEHGDAPLNKADVLEAVTFGQRVAEQETQELRSYFVETVAWKSIYAGDVDVLYGPKGSGKSALYSLLRDRETALRERGIVLISAENPSGAPVFRDLVTDPPASTTEFRNLWKLYVLSLVARGLRDQHAATAPARKLIRTMERSGLIPREASLRGVLRSVVDYLGQVRNAEGVEAGMKLDSASGTAQPVLRITFREPSASDRRLGHTSADELLEVANDALRSMGHTAWVLFDRLDVAFSESADLEANALSALFRMYLDIQHLRQLSLKIFLRNDIWQRITRSGFPEASHITRSLSIIWNRDSLLNLVVRRLLRNTAIRSFYGVDEAEVLADASKQEALFGRVFPPKVDLGARRPSTFVWMLLRTQDGTEHNAPRELIHLLSAARNVQRRRLQEGHKEPPGEALFDRASIRDALPEVSRERLEQTLYAEYPHLRQWLLRLKRERTEQTADSLARVWDVDRDSAVQLADELVQVGFFEEHGAQRDPTFWVPFLYRDALEMIEGSAD